jgi:hypothetical protein
MQVLDMIKGISLMQGLFILSLGFLQVSRNNSKVEIKRRISANCPFSGVGCMIMFS